MKNDTGIVVGRNYRVQSDEEHLSRYVGQKAKVLAVLAAEEIHRIKAKCAGETIYVRPEDLVLCKPGRPAKPKTQSKASQRLRDAARAAEKERLDDEARLFGMYVNARHIASEASKAIVEEIESGELVIESEEDLKQAALDRYHALGGADVLEVGVSTTYNEQEKEITIERKINSEYKEEEDIMKEENNTNKETVSLSEIVEAVEAIVTVRKSITDDPASAVVLDLAMSGLKSKVVGKVVAE